MSVCFGLGYKMEFDVDLMIPDKRVSLADGAIAVLGWQSSGAEGSFTNAILQALAKEFQFSLETPFGELPEDVQDIIINGTDKSVNVRYEGQRGSGVYPVVFEGLIKNVERRYRETAQNGASRNTRVLCALRPVKNVRECA